MEQLRKKIEALMKDGCNYGSFYSNHFAPIYDLSPWWVYTNNYSVQTLEHTVYCIQKDEQLNYLTGF